MNSPSYHAMAVGGSAGAELLGSVSDRRRDLMVHRFASAATALQVAQSIRFDLIVATEPLADIALEAFLVAARLQWSGCRRAGIIVLAERDDDETAHNLGAAGANRVLSLAKAAAQLDSTIAGLLAVAPRIAVRSDVRVAPLAASFPTPILCHTENVSATGMLVSGGLVMPTGTRFAFEMQLPEQRVPLRGRAWVVRHTDVAREAVRGFGAAFAEMEASSSEVLHRYLATVGA